MKPAPSHLNWLFFAIILLEGYTVLATELLAIRLVLPYVGNGADTVSIIIAAVLLPLAFGYHVGGKGTGIHASIRTRLCRNIALAAIILVFGLSYVVLEMFFVGFIGLGIGGRVPLAILYCLCFIVVPVYRLGQTVPLLTAYFPPQKQGALAGRILFFSTIGSFGGAILTTLVFMNTIGVHKTASIVLIVLGVLYVLISRRQFTMRGAVLAGMLAFGLFLNADSHLKVRGIVSSNVYNTVAVVEEGQNKENRVLLLNHQSSSMVGPNGKKFSYVTFVEKNLMPSNDNGQKRDILVVGAAGFTFGLEDPYNNYTFVDIDPAIKEQAEKHFLKQKLGPNKKFVPADIRAFLRTNTQRFDLVFLDAFSGDLQVPDALTTREFFADLKAATKPGGMFAGNFILSPSYADSYTRNIDATLRSVFPYLHRQVLGMDQPTWLHDDTYANIIYYATNTNQLPGRVYTDNKNPVAFDRPASSAMARRR